MVHFFQSLVLLVHASENTLTVNVKERRYLMRNLSWLVSLSVWNQTRDTQHMVTFLSTRTSWNMLSVLCVSTLTVWGGFATEADGVIPSDQNRRMLLKTYWKNFLNALLPYIVRSVSISWVAWPCVFQRQFLFFCVVCGPQCCCICTLRGQIACLDCKYRAVTNVSFYKSIRCFCWSRGLDSLCRFIGMSCCFFSFL